MRELDGQGAGSRGRLQQRSGVGSEGRQAAHQTRLGERPAQSSATRPSKISSRRGAHRSGENTEAHTGVGYIRAVQKLPPEAQRAADLALLHGADDYLILHNVACIHAALSQTGERQAAAHQDVAMALLRRAVKLWKQAGSGPNEIEQIKGDDTFKPLRERRDYRDLIEGGKAKPLDQAAPATATAVVIGKHRSLAPSPVAPPAPAGNRPAADTGSRKPERRSRSAAGALGAGMPLPEATAADARNPRHQRPLARPIAPTIFRSCQVLLVSCARFSSFSCRVRSSEEVAITATEGRVKISARRSARRTLAASHDFF